MSPRDLRTYRDKRDPAATPEPFGEEQPPALLAPGAPRRFVVQQHAARQLHWDLRLEIHGVLVSWAVPKGPSTDPEDKRLAVLTEDHPLEYADFEGVIPSGNYGAGAMIVWDCGVYRSVDGNSPGQGLDAGKLDLLLEGQKLRGRFALVRTRRSAGRDWLLLRKGEALSGEALETATSEVSVLSGLSVGEVAAGASRDDEVTAAIPKARTRPGELDSSARAPMLAGRGESPFSDSDWLFELKIDGVRALLVKDDDRVQIRVRSGADRTQVYPELANALRRIPLRRFAMDGEIAALDRRGRSSFEKLQRRFTQTDPRVVARVRNEVPVVFFAFDLLWAQGRDLRKLPLRRRKEILLLFCPRAGLLRFADHVEGDGLRLYEAAEQNECEGIVAKRADSVYESGRRSRHWLKLKVPRTAKLIVLGIVPGKSSRKQLGSLMVGWWKDGALVYAGNVGSGLTEDEVRECLDFAESAEQDAPAFEGGPERLPKGSRFLRPEWVCQVGYTEITSAGLLRHPVFRGFDPKTPTEACLAPGGAAPLSEASEPAPVAQPTAEAPVFTRLEKIFWPVEGYTKGDLIAYYEAIWPWLAPYLANRPLVLTRYPDGIEGKHFYQKNAPDFTPEWVTRKSIEGTDYFLCNDLRTLLYVINSGAIPLHVGSARSETIEKPDWLILDLDPKEAPFEHVVLVAKAIHRMLEALGAPHFVKTSGQSGLHIMLPLAGQLGHDQAKKLAEVLARAVCSELPEIATVVRPIAARGDKVYVDFLQNGRGKLIASPFSVRPRPGAPVSTPLTWRQVTRRLDPSRWNIHTTPKQMAKLGDPMAGLLEAAIDVPAVLGGLEEKLNRAGAEE